MYLDVLLDGGVIGLTLFLAMLVTALFVSSQAPRRTGDAAAAVVFGWIVLSLIHGCGESLFKLTGLPGFILFVFLFRLLWIAKPTNDAPLG